MQKKIKLISSIAIAGKLATSPHLASAGGLGKADGGSSAPNISMDQIGYPLDILTPPIDTSKALTRDDQGGKLESSPSGTIFAADLGKSTDSGGQPRIDFVINNIQNNDNSVVVFLAYSTSKGSSSEWSDLPLKNFSLDRQSFNIISAVEVQSRNRPYGDFNSRSNPLGKASTNKGNSVVVSLNLSDLKDPVFKKNNLYFQVIAIPVINGEFDFSSAKASELDHYTIAREDDTQTGSGSKTGDSSSGSKSGGSSGGDTGGK